MIVHDPEAVLGLPQAQAYAEKTGRPTTTLFLPTFGASSFEAATSVAKADGVVIVYGWFQEPAEEDVDGVTQMVSDNPGAKFVTVLNPWDKLPSEVRDALGEAQEIVCPVRTTEELVADRRFESAQGAPSEKTA